VKVLRQTQDSLAPTAAARARALVYEALAEALAGPVPGIERLLLDAVIAGARSLRSAACQSAALALVECPAPRLEALRQSYARLVSSPGRRPVVLYESLHRQGRLMGPATWDVERLYRALGLAPVDGEVPDHASLELAFLGHLAAAEAEARATEDGRLVARLKAEQQRFLRAHAGAWLPDVGAALVALTDDPFYVAVGHLLSGFLSEELSGRKRAGQIGLRLPTLKDPAACTLCGLCVGSCPVGVLCVSESGMETKLVLNPSQCVGCNRCANTCPQQVLSLWTCSQAGAAHGAGNQILRHSPRATCPKCGQPTVSQAELNAVFARLQVDPVTQHRLSLCVSCKLSST
jgi:TorA maturation chaperone TorD/ferredoxin